MKENTCRSNLISQNYTSYYPSLVKGRTCARDPVQQHFFRIPYGISTEAHVWHITQEHTNLINSRTSTITHFVEHSTRLYDCKSYILNSIYQLVTKNDFFPVYLTHINYHLFSCRELNDNELKTLPSGIFSNLSSLGSL